MSDNEENEYFIWEDWAIEPIALHGKCDEMNNMDDDKYGDCYAAAPWSIVLGNTKLLQLFITKNAKNFTPQLLCWQDEGFCTRRDHLINTKACYMKSIEHWEKKWGFKLHKGGIPLNMLKTILDMHDEDQEQISSVYIDTHSDKSVEGQEVVISSHGIGIEYDVLETAGAANEIKWTKDDWDKFKTEDENKFKGYEFAGSMLYMHDNKYGKHIYALVYCDGNFYRCDTQLEKKKCIKVENNYNFAQNVSGETKFIWAISNVFVIKDSDAFSKSKFFPISQVSFKWNEYILNYDFEDAYTRKDNHDALSDLFKWFKQTIGEEVTILESNKDVWIDIYPETIGNTIKKYMIEHRVRFVDLREIFKDSEKLVIITPSGTQSHDRKKIKTLLLDEARKANLQDIEQIVEVIIEYTKDINFLNFPDILKDYEFEKFHEEFKEWQIESFTSDNDISQMSFRWHDTYLKYDFKDTTPAVDLIKWFEKTIDDSKVTFLNGTEVSIYELRFGRTLVNMALDEDSDQETLSIDLRKILLDKKRLRIITSEDDVNMYEKKDVSKLRSIFSHEVNINNQKVELVEVLVDYMKEVNELNFPEVFESDDFKYEKIKHSKKKRHEHDAHVTLARQVISRTQ